MIKRMAIFCGSSCGHNGVYRKAAEELIDAMHAAKMALVYGGAKVGLMGTIANHMLNRGGEVIGVIPKSLAAVEIMHEELTELHIVNSMHERKILLTEKADGFVMLPGGIGSLDEFFEVLTLAQLGYHPKPCGIFNVNGYYDALLKFLDHAVVEGFFRQSHRNMIIVEESPQVLIQRFLGYTAPIEKKWSCEIKPPSLSGDFAAR